MKIVKSTLSRTVSVLTNHKSNGLNDTLDYARAAQVTHLDYNDTSTDKSSRSSSNVIDSYLTNVITQPVVYAPKKPLSFNINNRTNPLNTDEFRKSRKKSILSKKVSLSTHASNRLNSQSFQVEQSPKSPLTSPTTKFFQFSDETNDKLNANNLLKPVDSISKTSNVDFNSVTSSEMDNASNDNLLTNDLKLSTHAECLSNPVIDSKLPNDMSLEHEVETNVDAPRDVSSHSKISIGSKNNSHHSDSEDTDLQMDQIFLRAKQSIRERRTSQNGLATEESLDIEPTDSSEFSKSQIINPNHVVHAVTNEESVSDAKKRFRRYYTSMSLIRTKPLGRKVEIKKF